MLRLYSVLIVLSSATVNEPLFLYRHLKVCNSKGEVFNLVADYFFFTIERSN